MRKNISLSFLLRWRIRVFLLAASLLPSARGASTGGGSSVPATIYVTNNLSCGNTDFLNPKNTYVGGYDFFITSGSISGSAAADNVLGCGTFPAPPLSGNGSVPASGTTPSIPITSTAVLPVDAYFNKPSLLGCTFPGYPDTTYYAPYDLSGYLVLANSQYYYLSPFPSSGPVIPQASGDPNYPGPPYVFGPNSVTHTEIPSVMLFSFQCTNSGQVQLPHIQISYVRADTSSPKPPGADNLGTLKAFLGNFGSFTYVGPISLLVRSGNAYKLTVTYQTGTDDHSDLISWPPYVFNTGLVPGCSVVTNVIGLDCSSSSPLGSCPFPSTNSGATITGGFGMKNEFNWENTFSMEAYNGPVNNYRFATFTPLAAALVPPYYTFTAINVVPSAFFVNQGVPNQPYYLYGYLNFGTYSDFEYFQAPSYISVDAVNCTTTNLDVFELCPGYVQGNITLTGPTYGSSPPSPWLSLILDNTTFGSTRSVSPATFISSSGFDGNGLSLNSLYPYTVPNFNSSSIGATGGRGAGSGGNGSARVLFHSTGPSLDGSTLSGSYNLRLAGLSSVTGVPSSTWNPNQLNLSFYTNSTDGNVNMQETLQITDNNFINQTITCGLTNNHPVTYCFGEFDFTLYDTDATDTPYTAVSLTGTGNYTANGVNYSSSFSAIGVVRNGNGSTTHNTGLFRLFLPEGPYTITTTVTKGGGTYNQPPVPIYVYCGIKTNNLPVVNSCLSITNLSVDCVGTNNTYAWNFCVTNTFTNEIAFLSILDLPAGVTVSQDVVPLPKDLNPGDSACLTLYVTNAPGLTNMCFTIGAHSTNFVLCCSITNCLTFPPCCVSFSLESLGVISPPQGQGCYSYTFTVQNNTVPPVPIQYLLLVPDPVAPNNCITFTPEDIIKFSPPLLPGQAIAKTVKFCITPGCNGPFCFQAAALDTNLVHCCSILHCFPALAKSALGPLLTSLKCVDSALQFCLPTTAGETYVVESTKSLSPPQWTVQRTIVGDGSTVAVTNAITVAPQQFYRVRLAQ